MPRHFIRKFEMAGQPDLSGLQFKCVFVFLGSNALPSFEIPPQRTVSERASLHRKECFGVTDPKYELPSHMMVSRLLLLR